MLDDTLLELSRFYPTEEDFDYEYDRETVVTSAPVRRLQQKTQVFPLDIKASSRSRLTHSLEVQCRARQVIMKLAEKNDFYRVHLPELLAITEVSSLIHDVGNPPFGHFGEKVIMSFFHKHLADIYHSALGSRTPSFQWKNILAPDLEHFDGNAQSLRLLHSIQKMNLSAQVLASSIKVPFMIDESPDGDVGCFYSESMLLRFIRETLELDAGERFELVNIIEYADDISYALADVEDAMDRGLVSLSDIEAELPAYASDASQDLIRDMVKECRETGENFIVYVRSSCLPCAIDSFTDLFAAGLVEQDIPFNISQLCVDDANGVLRALIRYARERIFRNLEIEALEITGNASLYGLLSVYEKILMLKFQDFNELLRGRELGDPFMRRLVHRITHRALNAYYDALKSDDLFFESPEEKELYYRIRMIIDYVTGMTDTYIQSEYKLINGGN